MDNKYPSQEYAKATKKLLKSIENADTLASIRKKFKDFAKKYTVIPELMEIWLIKESTTIFKDYKESQKFVQIKKVKNLAKTHFYHYLFLDFSFQTFVEGHFGRAFLWDTTNLFSVTTERVDTVFDPFTTEVLFQALVFPHDKLKEIYRYTKKFSTYPIPSEIRERYKESRNLFREMAAYGREAIISASKQGENNRTECFIAAGIEYLQKTAPEKKMLIMENYESALGRLPWSKKLWKMYINYLKSQTENKKLLNLYSRFCRLFFDDPEAMEEYRKELEKHKGGMGIWWIDTIEFEKDFVGINSARNVLNRALGYCSQEMLVKYGLQFEKEYGSMRQYMNRYSQCIKIHPNLAANLHNVSGFQIFAIKIKIEFNYKNEFKYAKIDVPKYCTPRILAPAVCQNFSFCDGIIRYILFSSNSATMLKLIKSAKYFYCQIKSPVCHNLTVLNGRDHGPTFFPHSLFINYTYVDYPLMNNLTITNALIILVETKPTVFSILLPKLNLQILYLVLTDQQLNLSEFEILTNLKSLKCVYFDKVVVIKDDEGTLLSVEEIICMFTTIKEFSILNTNFTPETSKKLANQKRSQKIKIFEIAKIDQYFSPEDFIEFAKENLQSFAKITVHFSMDVPPQERKIFKQKIKNTLGEATLLFRKNN